MGSRKIALLALACSTLFVGAFAQRRYDTIAAAVQADDDLEDLLRAVQAAGLTANLSDGTVAWTLLAPDDDAFEDAVDKLANGNENTFYSSSNTELQTILLNHIIPRAIRFNEFQAGSNLTTLAGTTLRVAIADDEVTFFGGNGSRAQIDEDVDDDDDDDDDVNIQAGNSLIHHIDAVLLPATS